MTSLLDKDDKLAIHCILACMNDVTLRRLLAIAREHTALVLQHSKPTTTATERAAIVQKVATLRDERDRLIRLAGIETEADDVS